MFLISLDIFHVADEKVIRISVSFPVEFDANLCYIACGHMLA